MLELFLMQRIWPESGQDRSCPSSLFTSVLPGPGGSALSVCALRWSHKITSRSVRASSINSRFMTAPTRFCRANRMTGLARANSTT